MESVLTCWLLETPGDAFILGGQFKVSIFTSKFLNERFDSLFFVLVVLRCSCRIISHIFLSLQSRLLFKHLLLIVSHLLLEGVNSRIVAIHCLVLVALRVGILVDKVQDRAPVLLVLIIGLFVEIE